ncbi:uncharacterized protein MYCFIDRAFT_175785, partial [Pseudocercospora fijiensis CIRAD86]
MLYPPSFSHGNPPALPSYYETLSPTRIDNASLEPPRLSPEPRGLASTQYESANSPIEQPAGSGPRYPLGNGRAGAGSPSKEHGSPLSPSRYGIYISPPKHTLLEHWSSLGSSAREIQQREGLTPHIWGPPTTGSGHSTPLRETIPESPGSDSFPDLDAGQATGGRPNDSASSSSPRTRAGTVPSRFPVMAPLNGSPRPA